MRKLLSLVLGTALLLGVAVPVSVLILGRDLPPLDSRDEIQHTLKIFVEGQRQAALAGVDEKLVQPYKPLTHDDLTEALLAGVLGAQGCPDYFAEPKEEGSAWVARVVGYGAGQGTGPAGPGRCDLLFADRLAAALGLPSDAHRALAIHKLHNALDKEELLLDELGARYFAPGILGVDAASKKLMGKAPRQLTIAETAELLMAENDFEAIWRCRNPTVLKIERNNVIEQMAAFNLLKRGEADRAKQQPLHCLSRPG